MVFFNIKHLFISAFAVATLTGCGDSGNEPTPTPPVVEPVDDVVFFDDFDSFNSAYWSKETHEAGWTNQELQSYSTSQVKVAHGKKPVFSQCLDITSYICKKECDGEESLHRVGGMSTSGRND